MRGKNVAIPADAHKRLRLAALHIGKAAGALVVLAVDAFVLTAAYRSLRTAEDKRVKESPDVEFRPQVRKAS